MRSNKNWMGMCSRCNVKKAKFGVPTLDGNRNFICLPCATVTDRLFCGIYPGGIVYADRAIEEDHDYKRVAFLAYDDLALRIDDPNSPLLGQVKQDALYFQTRRGQRFPISGNSGVILGSRL